MSVFGYRFMPRFAQCTSYLRFVCCICGFLLLLISFAPAQSTTLNAPDLPPLKAWILMDYKTGSILAEYNSQQRLEPSSLTKMMTAYIVADALHQKKIALTDKVTISTHARSQEGSRMFIEQNSQIPVSTLFSGMLIQSGNDASVALAEYVAGSETEFTKKMNSTAQSIGLKHSQFMNATGLPHPEHLTSALDMAILARAFIRDFPDLYPIYSQKEFTWNKITQQNRNRLLWTDPSVDGIKTGHTSSAGYSLAASAKRNDWRLIAVVMGADKEADRYSSAQKLLNYGYQYFDSKTLYTANTSIASLPLRKGQRSSINVGVDYPLVLVFPKNQYQSLTAQIHYSAPLLAPIEKNQKIATLTISLQNQLMLEVPLIALETVEQSGIIMRLAEEIKWRLQYQMKYWLNQL